MIVPPFDALDGARDGLDAGERRHRRAGGGVDQETELWVIGELRTAP